MKPTTCGDATPPSTTVVTAELVPDISPPLSPEPSPSVHHKHQLLMRHIPRRGGPLQMQKHCSSKTRVHVQSEASFLFAPHVAWLRALQVPGHELHQPLVEEPPCGRKTARVTQPSSADTGPVRRPSSSARSAWPRVPGGSGGLAYPGALALLPACSR